MNRLILILLISVFVITISACSGEGTSNKDGEYETTKEMVVDILQTEEGKKVLLEFMTDEEMKKQLVIESDIVKDSINNLLMSEKGTEMWIKLFKDPIFIKDFSKSMAEEQKKLVKDLMHDPTFQKQLLSLLQNPEVDEQMLKVMKSQQFRAHLEETIKQTLETPLFQAKMTEVLLEAAEKKNKQEDEEKNEKEDPQSEN